MRLPVRLASHRCVWVVVVLVVILGLRMVSLPRMEAEPSKPAKPTVDPAYKKLVQDHVRGVLDGECRPGSSRRALLSRLPASSRDTRPFLWRDSELPEDLLQDPPPFGFRGLQAKAQSLLQLMPASDSAQQAPDRCRRCVVVGNGGILRGLELGSLLDRFDTVIRLNSAPLGEFSVDVGNRTSYRMSYPESTPLHWLDPDPQCLFLAVVYKSEDISWICAMARGLPVPLWDWLFFWKEVPDRIPLQPSRFRLLNPRVIREVAVDLLEYPPPRPLLWGWDQNVPTLGVSALNLASLLCDQVSLAGFGYSPAQQGAGLHYYDQLPMSFMLTQTMHNVDRETELLRRLVRDGTFTDLTGGVHCSFCPS
ncbi:lactosylceramide alpha-2,3-sialyltransferase [Salarias fasciatus]|uniref:Lactosylceramide alpha-2,3-sialyltransferase n=1 Tax=Salarias fasciatus TaxID=181472 RepID=A0A672FEU3_SALFA|nr:lactosylceramide alpha-2,3-sialyltransferase [Salarias fasciatus]XP_029971346.1 lactosylceramide alpha-2,3-sialyltransferase [Salarias fasciatus]